MRQNLEQNAQDRGLRQLHKVCLTSYMLASNIGVLILSRSFWRKQEPATGKPELKLPTCRLMYEMYVY